MYKFTEVNNIQELKAALKIKGLNHRIEFTWAQHNFDEIRKTKIASLKPNQYNAILNGGNEIVIQYNSGFIILKNQTEKDYYNLIDN